MSRGTVREYFEGIWKAGATIFDGMVITLANFLRRPATIQYPDRSERPVVEILPPRYRGVVEVDPAICTACKLCENACPISCIFIGIEKRDKVRGMTEFAVDVGKCMYCGLCVEPCPTGAIRMTREFEGACENLDGLVLRYIPAGQFVEPAKAKAALEAPTPPRGQLAREALRRAATENATLRERLGGAVRTAAAGERA